MGRDSAHAESISRASSPSSASFGSTRSELRGPMTNARGTKTLATAVLLLVAATSCSNNGSEPAAGGSTAPSEPATTTAPATSPSETEVASKAASKLLRRYFATVDRLRQQPERPIGQLGAVAVSTQLTAQEKLIREQRSNGLRQTGSTNIARLTVQSVNLDNTDPQAGQVPTVQIDVCYDVSGVDVLDKDGKSVVTPDRPETGWVRYSVANYQWKANPRDGWRVASGTDLERAPCAAS